MKKNKIGGVPDAHITALCEWAESGTAPHAHITAPSEPTEAGTAPHAHITASSEPTEAGTAPHAHITASSEPTEAGTVRSERFSASRRTGQLPIVFFSGRRAQIPMARFATDISRRGQVKNRGLAVRSAKALTTNVGIDDERFRLR